MITQTPVLIRCWSKAFYSPKLRWWPLRTVKRMVGRDVIRDNLRCQPKGKGNKAWKRVAKAMQAQRDDPTLLMWPDYLFPRMSADLT